MSSVQGFAENQRIRELQRCRTDLWYLATEKLDYGWNPKAGDFGKGLTRWLHKPLCDWFDRYIESKYLALFMSRYHHKTTLVVAKIIQDILRDPNTCLFYFHAVDENAEELVREVVYHIKSNPKLRSLDPVGVDDDGKPYNIFPAGNATKFYKSDQLTVNRHRFRRFPTLFGKGAGSEVTGKHADKAYLDDIVGRRTITNNELGKIKGWFQDTVYPVVDDEKFTVIGTRWHYEAVYEEWLQGGPWRSIVLPASVPFVDGKSFFDIGGLSGFADLKKKRIHIEPNYKLDNPIYGTPETAGLQSKKLHRAKGEMGSNFATQMMNDPMPSDERIWQPQECEHFIDQSEIGKLDMVVVFSDPAPAAIGSGDKRLEKQRADGSKDDWSVSVIGVRRKGDIIQRILLDGSFSKRWDENEGCVEVASFQKKYSTPYVAFDEIGRKWESFHKRVCIQMGAKFYWIKMRSLMKGKEFRVGRLAAIAKSGEFLIARSVPQDYLDKFLFQARRYPQVRFDDVIDSVALCTDEAMDDLLPIPIMIRSPFEDSEDRYTGTFRSRYCAI